MTTTLTTEQYPTLPTLVEEIRAHLGASGDYLTGSGDYGQGFWHNELVVDLEELAGGNMEGAFALIEDIHDTAGQSFRAYYGIDHHATLPDGVSVDAIAQLCADIFARREELTAGFAAEWDNGDYKADWGDDADGSEAAQAFWEDFGQKVGDLTCAQVYDLADRDNTPYIIEALESGDTDLTGMAEGDILSLLEESYVSDSDTLYVNYGWASDRIAEYVSER